METIQFLFSGGMADGQELNFYEAGRFQYGAARFIYTLEKFRQQGRVAARLSTIVKADIRIRASRPGSFIQDVVILALPTIADCAIKVPLDAMIAYVWDLLLPSTKSQDTAFEMAKIELAREREHTKQFESFRAVVESGNANTQQAMEIIQTLISRKNEGIPLSEETSAANLESIRQDLESKRDRENLIQNNHAEFAKIDFTNQRKLTGQMRNSVRDMTLPLRSSAEILSVGTPVTAGRYARIDPVSARFITDQVEDAVPTPLRGSVKMYDVETGFGKFRWQEYDKPVTFRVPTGMRIDIRDVILEAMKKEDVFMAFYIVRDSYGAPVYLVLDKIIEDDDA